MIQHGDKGVIRTHGFLMAVELKDWVNIDAILLKIPESLTWMEGCGQVEVEHLGELDVHDEEGVLVE